MNTQRSTFTTGVFAAAVLYHRDIIAVRTREALQIKIRKGERVGRVRFGYDLAEDGKMLVPNQKEQEALRLMLRLRSKGLVLRKIASELDRMGFYAKDGRPWQASTIKQLLDKWTGKLSY